jgi:hypothetical protein
LPLRVTPRGCTHRTRAPPAHTPAWARRWRTPHQARHKGPRLPQGRSWLQGTTRAHPLGAPRGTGPSRGVPPGHPLPPTGVPCPPPPPPCLPRAHGRARAHCCWIAPPVEEEGARLGRGAPPHPLPHRPLWTRWTRCHWRSGRAGQRHPESLRQLQSCWSLALGPTQVEPSQVGPPLHPQSLPQSLPQPRRSRLAWGPPHPRVWLCPQPRCALMLLQRWVQRREWRGRRHCAQRPQDPQSCRAPVPQSGHAHWMRLPRRPLQRERSHRCLLGRTMLARPHRHWGPRWYPHPHQRWCGRPPTPRLAPHLHPPPQAPHPPTRAGKRALQGRVSGQLPWGWGEG